MLNEQATKMPGALKYQYSLPISQLYEGDAGCQVDKGSAKHVLAELSNILRVNLGIDECLAEAVDTHGKDIEGVDAEGIDCRGGCPWFTNEQQQEILGVAKTEDCDEHPEDDENAVESYECIVILFFAFLFRKDIVADFLQRGKQVFGNDGAQVVYQRKVTR